MYAGPMLSGFVLCLAVGSGLFPGPLIDTLS